MRRAAFLFALAVLLWSVTLYGEEKHSAAPASAGVPENRWILIELDMKRLTLYEGTSRIRQYAIASGTWDMPSPIGSFVIHQRFKTEMSGFGTRFLGLNVPWGQYGIHGTNKPSSIGQNASHGCIRLSVTDAEDLFSRVPIGTRVYIEGGAYGLLGDGLRTLRSGDRCSHVQLVQQRLRQMGFYAGNPDGIYGAETSRAVKAARKAFGLNAEDVVDAALYAKLGIWLFE